MASILFYFSKILCIHFLFYYGAKTFIPDSYRIKIIFNQINFACIDSLCLFPTLII